MKAKICKMLLASFGKWLPLRRRPGGGIANRFRCVLVKGIIEEIGSNCIIEPGAEIMEGSKFGNNTCIGPNCMIGPQCIFKGHNMMAPNVHLFTVNHHYDRNSHRFVGVTEPNSIIIGEYVWLGYGVIILPGVNIGSHTIIGAGSVVTKDIPSGVVAAGNPCVVKRILDDSFYNQCPDDER